MIDKAVEIESGTFFALEGINLENTPIIYPRGIVLRRAEAYLTRQFFITSSPTKQGEPINTPAKETRRGFDRYITAELFIPESSTQNKLEIISISQTILTLLKLCADPGIDIVAGSNSSFTSITCEHDRELMLILPPTRERIFKLAPVHLDEISSAIKWTVENFESAQNLMDNSPEFRLMVSAFDAGQFHRETALAMVSLWGALEAIFSPSTTELKFRVSSLIAAFLHPSGATRLQEQRRVAKLYDKRSAAAHGKPRHTGDDLLETFELVRSILIKFIEMGRVPERDYFEELLFGIKN